jgi:hypothetical protein
LVFIPLTLAGSDEDLAFVPLPQPGRTKKIRGRTATSNQKRRLIKDLLVQGKVLRLSKGYPIENRE